MRRVGLLALVLALLAGAVWFGLRPRDDTPRTITLYAFSAMDDALDHAVLPAFRSHWRSRTGESVQFITTYTGSGAIVDRIVRRFPAQVAVLASEIDAERLVKSGVVLAPVWKRSPHGGIVSRSPLVFQVREGNPSGLRSWADLAGDVRVVAPDPRTSGLGEWAILALFDDALARAVDRDRALEEVRALWSRSDLRPDSARAAATEFADGAGDVLVTYASEAAKVGVGAPGGATVHPPRTVLSEHVALKIARNVQPEDRELVDALLEFLWSAQAQALLEEHGFLAAAGGEEEAGAAGAETTLRRLRDLGGAGEAARIVDAVR